MEEVLFSSCYQFPDVIPIFSRQNISDIQTKSSGENRNGCYFKNPVELFIFNKRRQNNKKYKAWNQPQNQFKKVRYKLVLVIFNNPRILTKKILLHLGT